MARSEEILVPDIGDFDQVEVVDVLVGAGDTVARDDSLITLESDKATMDVPSPRAGKVGELKVKNGDKVGEGAVILTLEVDEAPPAEEPSEPVVATEEEPSERVAAAAEDPAPPPSAPIRSSRPDADSPGKAYASPAVRRFARELGVDLTRVRGTGRKQRVLREDVRAHVKQAMSGAPAAGGAALPEMPIVDFSRFGEIERVPMSRIQKIAAVNLRRSWLNVPHVTQHDEADVTELEAFRKAHAESAKQQGYKLTPVAFLMKASVAALKEFPRVNASLDADGEHLILKKHYHLGIAVDTAEGLVVPVVRDVDQKTVGEVARELAEVSERARGKALKLDEMRGASFTISSLGGIGGTAFTPVVNAPEVAILGVSRMTRKPVWRDGDFVARLMLPLSLSYDHRVIDGALAARFTTYLSHVLSDIRRLLL